MKKKLYTLIALAFTVLPFSSCLDIDPESELTDQTMWQSEGQFDAFTVGVHSDLRNKAWNCLLLGEVRSDIYSTAESAKFGGVASKVFRFATNTLDETNYGIGNYADFYYNINQINLFIMKAQESGVLPEAKRNYYLGQMYGLRAFYYFHLLRSWNNVVWNDQPSLSFEIGKLDRPVTPAAEIMANIKKDIETSLECFGKDYSFKRNKNYWSKAATLMLKAEAYLWSSRQMNGGKGDAESALSALKDIQTNVSSLKLMDNYKDIFAYSHKMNSEIIFALHYEEENGENEMLSGEYRMNYCLMKGDLGKWYDIDGNKIDTKVDNFDGVGYYLLNNNLLDSFNKNDSRRLTTIKPLYDKNKNFIANIAYKYQGRNRSGEDVRTMCDDYPIYRYADLLLMIAEAKSLTGGDPTAEINQIRKRAFGENYNEEVAYPNQEIDKDVNEAILKERFLEFMLEGKRWYDLRRFGNEYVFKYTTANPNYPGRLIWPIDVQTMVKNPAIHQTEGYDTLMK